MVIITIILICIIVFMACVFVYAHSYYFGGPGMRRITSSGASAGDVEYLAGDSLDPYVIKSFPTFFYSEVKALKIGMGGLECVVCLNEFKDDETLRLLPHCSHAFHSDCIDKWLSLHVTCPMCRADITDSSYAMLSPSVSCEDESATRTSHESISPNSEVVVGEFIVPIEIPITRFTTKMGPMFNPVAPGGSGRAESVVKPGEEWDRFTLRLPEEVQSKLMRSRLNRTRSCVGFGRARSLRKGEISRSGSIGYDRVYKNYLYSEGLEYRSEFMGKGRSVSSRFNSNVSDDGGSGKVTIEVNSE